MTHRPTERTIHTDVHPRPQLARERWLELDGEWGFAYDDDEVGLQERWASTSAPFDRRIIVPYPPEAPASGIGDTSIHPVMWYRREVGIVPAEGRRWLLHFGAVDYSAQVFVNGAMVCRHAGGHTPFVADITNSLNVEGPQVITVRAEDRPSLAQPRGKQYWADVPEEIWYDRTSGIWQPVWLEDVADVRIDSVRWTPDVERLALAVEVTFEGPLRPGLRLRVALSGPHGPVADDVYAIGHHVLRREIGVDIGAPSVARRREYLWSPEYPNLLEAELTLMDGPTPVDEVRSYTGLRSTGVQDNAFRLNGWPYYLRLVLAQGYWPQSHLAAPDADALRREVQLIKELGFNGVRVHQKIEDPRFLHWCDRLGLLVWEEMPSCYVATPQSIAALAGEWLEVLRRDHSHPCVAAWVPCNESWGAEWMRERRDHRALPRALRALADSLDGTRPVVANDGWEYDVGDIIGIHDYVTDPDELRRRYGTREALEASLRAVQPNGHPIVLPGARRGEEPVVLSEFGGVTLSPGSADDWFGYGVLPDEEALAVAWERLFEAVLSSQALAGFCYTQLSDTRQETNGILTEDREPKVDPARVRAAVRRAPPSIPAEAIMHNVLDSGVREPETRADG